MAGEIIYLDTHQIEILQRLISNIKIITLKAKELHQKVKQHRIFID